MAKKRSRLLRVWFSLVVVPIILYFVFSLAVNRTIGNPEFYRKEIHERRLAEVISSRVPKILGQNSPMAQNLQFDAQWTEETLGSLIKGLLDYLNGKTAEPRFDLDLAPIYNQLPEVVRSGQVPLPGIARLAVETKGGKVDLTSHYRDSEQMQLLMKLGKYIRISKIVEYVFAAVVIATICLTILLKKDKREILFLLGSPLMTQGLALATVLWVSNILYIMPGTDKVLERYAGNWALPLVQAGAEGLSSFIEFLVVLSLYTAAAGLAMLLAEWALRSAASRPRVSSRESGVGSVKELPV